MQREKSSGGCWICCLREYISISFAEMCDKQIYFFLLLFLLGLACCMHNQTGIHASKLNDPPQTQLL